MPGGSIVEIALSEQIAGMLGLEVDDTVRVNTAQPFDLLVVGLFEPADPAAPIWDDLGDYLVTLQPVPEEPFLAGALTDPAGVAAAAERTGALGFSYRLRVDERRLDAGQVDGLVTALTEAKRSELFPGGRFETGLDQALTRFADQLRAARALLAVVLAGLLATLLGLLVLAARLSVDRRREELSLLRARGGSIAQVGLRTVDEALVVVPLILVAAWYLGTRVPGRPGGADWAVVVVGVVALLTVPLVAMASHRLVSFAGRRRDLVRQRPSIRRLTAEIFVVVLAALGIYLLRRRGLSGGDAGDGVGVDPYLASVPVLLAVAAALIGLRLYPAPVGQLGKAARGARGVVAFLGLARAGRGAPVGAVSLAVLVVAISTAVFSGAVTSTVDAARDAVADREVAADAALSGEAYQPDTAQRIAAVPGVEAVAALVAGSGQVSTGDGSLDESRALTVLLVDAPALAGVTAASGAGGDVPDVLLDAAASGGPLPAVVSPAAADLLGGDGSVRAFQRDFPLTPAVVADHFPGLPVDVDRFIVLPLQAVPDRAALAPNRFLVAGDELDAAALAAAADAGRIRSVRTVLGREVAMPLTPTEVLTWADRRSALDRTGANDVLSLAFTTGAVAGSALALLAVAFAVLAGARSRGQALSRLRTMGLSGAQGRGLLVVELVPSVLVAVLAGGLVGVLLPGALRPALGLDAFTGGVGARVHIDPLLAGGSVALVVVALATAVLVENLTNRRLRLGAALRLGEES